MITATYTTLETRATCEACTIARILTDCPACPFDYGDAPRATKADITRIWEQLWGSMSAADVGAFYAISGGEVLDLTQI